tara:strand:- start:7310 stop:8134 length:825 start_codon:yes stop_codon:yes gene_type:complete
MIRHQKIVADLYKKIADESKKEAAKAKSLNSIERSITNSTSNSTLRSKQQQINRLLDEIAKIQVKKAEYSRKLANEESRLANTKDTLLKEEAKERKKIEDAEKKREREQLNYQRSITNELESQYRMTNQKAQNIEIKKYDVFISHASEDKELFVKPLVGALQKAGYKVWYDEFTLKVGDSLRRSIDNGLINSRFGIVVFSSAFFEKNWTQYELDGLVNREMNGHKVILPIWHLVTKDQVQNYSPSLADKKAINTSLSTIDEIVAQLAEVLDTDK